jgi:hypothetical protein
MPVRAITVLVVLLAAVGSAGVSAQEDPVFPADTVAVGLSESATPNIDVTVELSLATFADGAAQRVLIGRDDVFADSLASGVAQDDGPLVLVLTDGPVPLDARGGLDELQDVVEDRLVEVGAQLDAEHRASVLGWRQA